MATGTVKWFNNAKGYGFVLPEAGGDDLFIHYSSIQMDGYKSLKAGQGVVYELQEGPKGLHAVDIRPTGIDQSPDAQVDAHADAHSNGDGLTAQPVVEIAPHACDKADAGSLAQPPTVADERRVALEEH